MPKLMVSSNQYAQSVFVVCACDFSLFLGGVISFVRSPVALHKDSQLTIFGGMIILLHAMPR